MTFNAGTPNSNIFKEAIQVTMVIMADYQDFQKDICAVGNQLNLQPIIITTLGGGADGIDLLHLT